MRWCGQCATFHSTRGACYPAFRVVHDGEEHTICAPTAEAAVERWARAYDVDSADYTIVGGSAERVRVIDDAGVVTYWRVYGETVPEYHARETEAFDEDE